MTMGLHPGQCCVIFYLQAEKPAKENNGTERLVPSAQSTLQDKTMLSDLDICRKIAKISQPENLMFDQHGYPVIKVLSAAQWMDYDPVNNAEQLKSLIKTYMVNSEFRGAGVVSRAHAHAGKLLIHGSGVFHASYEKSILLAIIDLFKAPELKDFISKMTPVISTINSTET